MNAVWFIAGMGAGIGVVFAVTGCLLTLMVITAKHEPEGSDEA